LSIPKDDASEWVGVTPQNKKIRKKMINKIKNMFGQQTLNTP